MSGKGSTARPFDIDAETFASNWDAIFKKKGQDDSQPKEVEHGSEQDGGKS